TEKTATSKWWRGVYWFCRLEISGREHNSRSPTARFVARFVRQAGAIGHGQRRGHQFAARLDGRNARGRTRPTLARPTSRNSAAGGERRRGQRTHTKADSNLPPSTIEQTLAVFDRWLILPDRTSIYAVLGSVAANLLPGDPVWLGLIGPPSSAKTEILNSTS